MCCYDGYSSVRDSVGVRDSVRVRGVRDRVRVRDSVGVRDSARVLLTRFVCS